MIVQIYNPNENRTTKLRLGVADIEEAVARCGWQILDAAWPRTIEEDDEVDRLEAQGYAESSDRTQEDAKAWWDARVISEGVA